MQLIPFRQLQALASKQLLESEQTTTKLYEDFKKEYGKTFKRLVQMGSDMPEEATYQFVVQGWIKDHCPPIQLLGEGSSRGSFACGDGKCIKVAKNESGITQNMNEAKNTMSEDGKQYPIFAQTYSIADGNTSLLTECCAKITNDEWAMLWDINDPDFVKGPETYILEIANAFHESGNNWDKCIPLLRKAQGMFARKIQAAKSPAMKTLVSLFKFYASADSHWNDLMPFDLCTAENWGAAIRFSQVVPVIIDAGFSGGTLDKLLAMFG